MEAIGNIQIFVLEKFIPFVILLGLLIFVHELGHFLVAKYCKVRVEVFSLGFGKKILKFVKGHTTYCISLIPLGGYVKMFGDDPSAEVSEELRGESFSHKTVGQRIAIVLAGPLMNFFFAIFLFAGIGLNGEKAIGPIVGDVDLSSAAWKAGFRSGDTVVSVDKEPLKTWKELNEKIQSGAGKEFDFQILRGDKTLSLPISPISAKNPDILQWQENVGTVEGLSPLSLASYVGVGAKNSPAYKAGLRSIDQITEVDGKKIKTWNEFKSVFNRPVHQSSVQLTVKRESKEKTKNLKVKIPITSDMWALSAEKNLAALGIEPSSLYIYQVSEEMPAQLAGVKRGDKILSINGQRIQKWEQVLGLVNSYKPGDPAIQFNLLREGHPRLVSISPKENTFMNGQGQEVTKYQVGIGPAIFQTVARPIVLKSSGIFAAFTYGIQQTLEWTKTISISFVRLLQAKVSPKNIGGVFTIGQLASETFKMGLSPYLKIMAIISINLFILNLLPIPILDGGHLVFFILEALRGAPLSLKKTELAQQIGLILLMSLMAYAIFNDISRIW